MKFFWVIAVLVVAAGCGGVECPDLLPWQQVQYEAATPRQRPLLCAHYLFENHQSRSGLHGASEVSPENDPDASAVFTVDIE